MKVKKVKDNILKMMTGNDSDEPLTQKSGEGGEFKLEGELKETHLLPEGGGN